MNTTKLTFDQTGWLEINYIQVGDEATLTLQSTSYHPTQLGLIQADCAAHGVTIEGDDAQAIAQWVADYVPPAPPILTVADFDAALTAHLDTTAQQKRYDNRITCMVRAGFPGPFQAEGLAFAVWMDQCNARAYKIQEEVLTGVIDMPSVADFLKLMPSFSWPSES